MGKVSFSIPNSRHHVTQQATNQKPVKTTRTLEALKIEGDESPRASRGKVALKVTQFNQNGNHSGGATKDDKETSPTNDKTSSNGSAGASPVGGASTSSPTHSAIVQPKAQLSNENGDSRSSSVEELATINEDEGTDSNIPALVKPDPTKSKSQHPSSSVGAQPHYSHSPHHHADPASYGKGLAYASLSQPPPQGVPQGITQGIVPPPSLSQQDHRYMYDHHLAYAHSSVYGHPSMPYEAPPTSTGRHHHISPPHASQPHGPHKYILPAHGYRPLDYVEHGSHDHHMTHRGLPPTIQYQQYTSAPPHHKLTRHEAHSSKSNILLAHEAAGNGDIKTLVSGCGLVNGVVVFVY